MPDRLDHDPSKDICPDFSHDRHLRYRQFLIADETLPDITNDEQAIEHMQNDWRTEIEEHVAQWNQQVEEDRVLEHQRQQQEEETTRLREEEEREQREESLKEKEKKRETLHPFVPGQSMNKRPERLQPFAQDKMEK
ncbi:hypothetical protein E1B28_010641 [Marasmius oreades]|uniref:Uncharacterized protein n=1 Tax=Marasmius oreades TaxID=181124 RepID=A0A9P7URC4_9AGAR|nr:uncharacterized protein E1B28_010641 [Marasmius oreades]KAG7091622.1 hypothetical protein E1B28_010641 [Marasmius oreades]